MSEAGEEKYVDLWIGARWGLWSGAYGGAIAGIVLGLGAALLVQFTDFELSGLEIFSVFWIAGVYGFILGILGGALGGLIGGALAGATRLPQNMPLAGVLSGALLGSALIVLFFLAYALLNRVPPTFGLFAQLAPVAVLGVLGGVIGGFFAGRRFAQYYEIHPPISAYESRWEE